MAYNPGSISGNICDAGTGQGAPLACNPIRGKGIVYAMQCPAAPTICSTKNANIVARAYVDQSKCKSGSCGLFNLTGLAPGNYLIEGSAGADNGIAYSLTNYGYPNLTPIPFQVTPLPSNPNSNIGNALPLRRAPLVCGLIQYYSNTNSITPIRSLKDNPYLIAAGFESNITSNLKYNQKYNLSITVEGTDPSGHVFRFQGNSSDTTAGDLFNLTTGVGVKYVGADPYGTEFAGLPAPEDLSLLQYTLSVSVWVSGYIQPLTETALVWQSPGPTPPSCSSPLPAGSFTVSPNPIRVQMGGLITGTLQFCGTFPPSCTLESPHNASASLPIHRTNTSLDNGTDSLFGGNVLVEAFDGSGLLRGITVINGTWPNGTTSYRYSTSLRFYMIGFSEYYNHSLSGSGIRTRRIMGMTMVCRMVHTRFRSS